MTIDSNSVAAMRHAVAACLRELRISQLAEVGITLVDNDEIARYNREYRQIDRPTDVLAFPLADEGLSESPWFTLPPVDLPGLPPVLLGDIVISVEYAAAEALGRDISLDRELARLTIHGCLHLLGYDHDTDTQDLTMEELERRMVTLVCIDDRTDDQ